MAVAVTAASRAGTHLAAGHRTPWPPRLRAAILLACTGPWALFMLWSSTAPALQSLRQLERFGETLTPGFFLLKWAVWLLACLVLLDAVAAVFRRPALDPTP